MIPIPTHWFYFIGIIIIFIMVYLKMNKKQTSDYDAGPAMRKAAWLFFLFLFIDIWSYMHWF